MGCDQRPLQQKPPGLEDVVDAAEKRLCSGHSVTKPQDTGEIGKRCPHSDSGYYTVYFQDTYLDEAVTAVHATWS